MPSLRSSGCGGSVVVGSRPVPCRFLRARLRALLSPPAAVAVPSFLSSRAFSLHPSRPRPQTRLPSSLPPAASRSAADFALSPRSTASSPRPADAAVGTVGGLILGSGRTQQLPDDALRARAALCASDAESEASAPSFATASSCGPWCEWDSDAGEMLETEWGARWSDPRATVPSSGR